MSRPRWRPEWGLYSYNAIAQGGPGYGPGWMMGGGYGPGYHDGHGGGGGDPGPERTERIARPFGQNDRSGPAGGYPTPAKVTVRVITCAVGAAVTAPA